MRFAKKLVAASTLVFVVTMPLAGQTSPPKTVIVRCDKGQTIKAALNTSADVLVIEITGMCNENVTIGRRNVTLRGSDPAVDGIRAIAPSTTRRPLEVFAALSIRQSDFVYVENLTLTNATDYGLFASDATVLLQNCRFVANTKGGARITGGSFANVIDSTFTENSGRGLEVGNISVVILEGGSATDNGGAAIAGIGANSNVIAVGFNVAGNTGITVGPHSGFRAERLNLDATGTALQLFSGASAELRLVTVEGRFRVDSKAKLDLFGVTQIANPGSNSIQDDSTISINALVEDGITTPSTLLGEVAVQRFSQLLLDGSSAISGNLSCSVGGRAYCADPSKISGSVTGCDLCTKP